LILLPLAALFLLSPLTHWFQRTASSGPPSYTVDAEGKFVGWTRDSGEFQTPGVVWTHDMKKEPMDVERFLERAKIRTPNKALEAISEPVPSVVSSAPQG